MNGAAGFAYALLRMAALHDDERLFGLADLWSAAAVWQAGTDEAFFNAELELTPGVIGRRSFYHHEAGAHAVQALVAAARADDAALRSAVDAFVRAADGPCPALDVSFGRAGLLIGCAQLVEAMPAGIDTAVLRSLGDRLCEDIDHELAGEPPIAESSRLTQVGAAHGWAGHLYALLRWTAATGRTPVPALAERLGQLAGLGQMRGRAMRWPIDIKTPVIAGPLSASWCNGSAGFVPLWALADTVYGGHTQLAAASAWGAYEDTHAAGGDICCGLAGRAYALIAMYHHSGETVWLSRARRLAETAAERVLNESFRRDSLYKGEVGVALLVDELSTAEPAGLPLFAPEGWPHRNKEDRT
jgi:serine/threonine-protein kinase